MGTNFSSSADNLISSSLVSSQLIHRHTLSTCYDAIFDISLSSTTNSILLSDDGRLRSFSIDLENNCQLIETTISSNKVLTHEQIHDIVWSTQLNRFLVLTSKRLTTYDQENNLIDLDLGLEKNSPPFWRMACWSSHLIVNLGLGISLRYHTLSSSSSIPLIQTYTRSSLGYTNSDLLSSVSLSPQLILAINVELTNNRHVIDLFSIADEKNFQFLKRIHTNEPCALDIITSLRDYTWLCKSHWPSDDCLCLIESDGQVNKLNLHDQNGYILNLRLLTDRSHLVIIRTANKLPKEIDPNELNRIDEDEEQQQQQITHGRKREIIGKLPGNLLLEIYKIPDLVK
ncbi:hypothetical protein I4U23_019832 [Adineta vaga]|nr:hypothetical protein I4U23_019832 [Adineta vaga]